MMQFKMKLYAVLNELFLLFCRRPGNFQVYYLYVMHKTFEEAFQIAIYVK